MPQDQALDRAVEFYFQNGLAASTQRSYGSAKNRYAKFCSSKHLSPLPAPEHQLCQFVSHLANENFCHSMIKCCLSPSGFCMYVAECYGDPNICNMARLEQVIKGIKSVQAKSSKKPARLPITPELLRKMRQVWMRGNGSSSWDNIMLWAASLLGFFGFLDLEK